MVSNRTWENRPSGIIGGPRETQLELSGIVNPPCNRQGSAVTLHLQLARAGSTPTRENAGQPDTT